MASFKVRRQGLFTGGLNIPAGTSSSFNGAASFAGVNVFSGCTTFSSSANRVFGTSSCIVTGMLWGKAAVLIPESAAGSTGDTSASVGTVPVGAYVFINPYTNTACFMHLRTSVSSTGTLVSLWRNVSSSPTTTACAVAASYMWIAVW